MSMTEKQGGSDVRANTTTATSQADGTYRLVGHKWFTSFDDIELRARRIAELMALLFQGSLLLRHAPQAVADAFCASRLGRDWGSVLGTLPAGLDLEALIERVHHAA